MDQPDLWLIFHPPQKGNAAAFRAEVHRDKGEPFLFAVRVSIAVDTPGSLIPRNIIHRRKASVNPPSTGIMWPLVQGDFGPARKRMASAQSLGSIGRCVSVRLA